MKTYKPKSTITVRAGKIVKFNRHKTTGVFPNFTPNTHAVLDDGSEHEITPEMQSRMNACVGDYLVFAPNPDGATDYVYLNPCDVFEAKYEEIAGVAAIKLRLSDDDLVRPPKQGEIVAYHHPGSLDGRYPPQTSPAIVQQVTDDKTSPLRCHLFVFGSKGQHMDWCEYGHGPSQWTYR